MRSRFWVWIERAVWPGSKMVLSESWRELAADVALRWMHTRSFVVPLHPHGVLPMGSIINGLTFGTGGLRQETASGAKMDPVPESPGNGLHQRIFPYMKLRAAVASGCFFIPGSYDLYTKLGAFDVSEPFIRERLREDFTVAIMPGGAVESRYAYPSAHVLKLLSRKGFVRVALEERRHLLPMYTFGDNGLLPQPRDCPAIVVKLQDLVKGATGLLMPPLLAGLPVRGALTTIIGVPVDLSDLWPSECGGTLAEGAIDTAHARYVADLRRLFDTNKALVPGNHATQKLLII
jgi:hypothetical protein